MCGVGMVCVPQLLLRRGGHRFTTSSEREIVRQIKETCCYVAFNPQREEGGPGTSSVGGDKKKTGAGAAPQTRHFDLPDGTRIDVSF
jgi:hypothetical protein